MYAERFQTFSGLISRAEKALQRAKAENVRGYGLRSVHVSCLLALYEHEEGLTGTELAAVCGVDRAQISRVAAELTLIATDTRHGGMGNFIEIFGMCLEAAAGGTVTQEILAGAKCYKL